MALRVWLPLNGTLENKGISDVTVTNNGATIGSGGKIGQCYGFTGSQYLYSSYNFYNTTYSISVWIYSTSASATQTIICDRTAVGSGFSTFLIGGKLRIDAGGNALQWTTNYSYPINQWFHLTITYDGTNVNYYINGEFKETKAQTIASSYWGNITSIGASQANGSNYSNYLQGRLNDVRIYDHCLSPKEVKEISQGLVLHYKLDGWSGGTGENLVWNSNWNKNSTSPPESWTNWGSPPTREIVQIHNKYWLHVISNTTQYQGYSQNWTKRAGFGEISAGEILTVSFTAYLASAASIAPIGIHWCNTSSTIVSQVWTTTSLTATPTRYSFTYTTPANCAGFNIMVGDNTNTAHEIWITDIKVERGSVATPWSPAPEDLGIDTTKITDSSGYGHDGTILSNPYTNSDADRYQISTYFDGVDDGILIENLTLSSIINDQVSYSFWIKPNGENGARSVYFGSYSSTSWSIEKTAGNVLRLYWNGSPDETCSGATITDGIWQHIVVTKSGTNNIKVYINGVQKWTSTAAHNTLSFPTTYRIGRDTRSGDGTPYHGLMSDFRIYATALSAEDISDLYHTSANIDNEKRLHSFEFVEDDGNIVDEQGLVHSGLLSSDSDLIKLLYDKKLHVEPDGSVWAHIYHHNRPDLGSFASTNDFANSVKIDDNRWFNVTEIVNSFSSEWEFLIIYNFTQGGTVYKERWIQTKNPETAVFGDVDAADITRVTGNGYRTGTWGGLYKKNSSAYWVMNNGTNGNWWGATGSFSIYQGGIPGYGGTITTTGCNDLYIRIDRFSSTPTQASIGRGSVYTFNDFIEK